MATGSAAAEAVVVDKNSLATEAPFAPVTIERRVRTDLENYLPKPCKSFFFFFSFKGKRSGITLFMTHKKIFCD